MKSTQLAASVTRTAWIVGTTAMVIVAIFVLPPFRNYQLATIAAYVCATAGLTVLIGRNGQLSLGHGALMACGAYTFALTANSMGDAGATGIAVLLVPLAAAVVITSIVGVIVGAAAARLHGPYLAGLTLALVVAIPSITTTFSGLLGGDQGLWAYVEGPPSGIAALFTVEQWHATIAVLAAAVTVLALSNLTSGEFGRRMQAVRDDEIAARLAGIDVTRTKIATFVASSGAAGLGGGVLAMVTQSASPGAFGVTFSLFLLMGVVVGGLGSHLGAVWGAVLLVVLPALVAAVTDSLHMSPALAERLDGNLAIALFGLAVIAVVLVAPAGLQGLFSRAVHAVSPRGRSPRHRSGSVPAPVPVSTTSKAEAHR
ncbi:branched-chain amino acid transport system permease protein [Rhodococcus sp. SMB37]|uniref:branched-chain amino acid ABC transporter permease n=1 Tax=Rhodococcus sp. SMB37 TaxID=2512213 RepID=UPI00104A0A7F|nr:branched-chain amino acid ABC transporter permease [Rhodococcus sp. SMB37]TCN58502.1 branched-chain amino acid transport system permease protein [Rhodococcus sp. SMB37]